MVNSDLSFSEDCDDSEKDQSYEITENDILNAKLDFADDCDKPQSKVSRTCIVFFFISEFSQSEKVSHVRLVPI